MVDCIEKTTPAPVGELAFKAAMRNLAATMTLVTTSHGGQKHGMPATSVTALSAEPPSILVCINRSASMHGPTERSRHLCVNMLAQDQAWLCNEFGALKGGARFSVGQWLTGPHGLPYLDGATAAVFCTVEGQFDYATHTIFAARIDAIEMGRAPQPLLYQAGSMGRFVPLPRDATASQETR